jgi:hypothetical protein
MIASKPALDESSHNGSGRGTVRPVHIVTVFTAYPEVIPENAILSG